MIAAKTVKKISHTYLEPGEIAGKHLREMVAAGVVFDNKNILDLGCGTGMYTSMMAELGAARVTGVDIGKENIELAQQMNTHNNVDFICSDIETFQTGRQYDLVMMRGVIYYLKTDWNPVVLEIKSLLVDQGVLLISFLDATARSRILNRFKKIMAKMPGILKPIMRNTFAALYYVLFSLPFFSTRSPWRTIKDKMNTIFFPAVVLRPPAVACGLLEFNGMKVVKVFRGQGQDKMLTDDYMVWAVKASHGQGEG